MVHTIQSYLKKFIEKYLFQKKAMIVYCTRQTGKTTLRDQIMEPYKNETLLLIRDVADTWKMLSNM